MHTETVFSWAVQHCVNLYTDLKMIFFKLKQNRQLLLLLGQSVSVAYGLYFKLLFVRPPVLPNSKRRNTYVY